MPKISIIIPVYNAEKHLVKCLDSVYNQTFDNYEVICVNDGSTDSSLDILNNYNKKYSNLTIINQTNSGVSVARNNALKHSTGDYIFFLDSDDSIHQQCLEILYHFLSLNNAQLVCAQLTTTTANTNSPNLYFTTIQYKEFFKPLFESLQKDCFKVGFQVCAKLFEKRLLEDIEFIPDIHFEDFPFLYTVLAKHPKTIVLDTELYFYTVNPKSISHKETTPQQICDYFTGIKYVFNIYNKPHLEKERLFLLDNFIPRILSHQFGRCRHSEKQLRSQMYANFRKELQWLDNNNFINWSKLPLHRRIQYYFIFKEYLWYK